MRTFSLVILSLFIFSNLAHGQEAKAEISTSVGQQPKSPWSPSLTMGFKSYNGSGRFGELNDSAKAPSKGRLYSGKQEVSAGVKFNNGWGSYLQFSQTRSEFNDSTLNKWSASDPSISLVHPDLYNNGSVKVSGMFRAYIPYTDRSRTQNIRHYAYYSNLNYLLKDGADLYNGAVIRFFPADIYKGTDTRFPQA